VEAALVVLPEVCFAMAPEVDVAVAEEVLLTAAPLARSAAVCDGLETKSGVTQSPFCMPTWPGRQQKKPYACCVVFQRLQVVSAHLGLVSRAEEQAVVPGQHASEKSSMPVKTQVADEGQQNLVPQNEVSDGQLVWMRGQPPSLGVRSRSCGMKSAGREFAAVRPRPNARKGRRGSIIVKERYVRCSFQRLI